MLYMVKVEEYVLEDGSESHVVGHPDLPGCHGLGSSFEEAMDRLALAREAYLGLLEESGAPIPDSGIFKSSDGPQISKPPQHIAFA